MKTTLLIIIGIGIGISVSVFADFTSWNPRQAMDNKTAEVQIWCEIRTSRIGWENYCKWNEKYWELTCLGVERFLGKNIKPTDNGMYGCEDYE